MATLVFTTSASYAGDKVTTKSLDKTFMSESLVDSHGKCVLRVPRAGKYSIGRSSSHLIQIVPEDHSVLSVGHNTLLDSDKEYLEWLELSPAEKLEAFKAGSHLSKWMHGVRIVKT